MSKGPHLISLVALSSRCAPNGFAQISSSRCSAVCHSMADSQADPPQRTPTQEFQRLLDELDEIRNDCTASRRLRWKLSGVIERLRNLARAFDDLDHNRMPTNTMPLDMTRFQCNDAAAGADADNAALALALAVTTEAQAAQTQ